MAASDAKPVPIKNTAFRATAPILDADGDPVTGAAALDSEVSIDGAAFADCTNEATEIGTSGIYTLDLTSGEMNGDTIVVRIQTSTSGAKTTILIFNPQESGDIKVEVQSYASGQAPLQPTVAARTLDVSATGEAGLDWANIGSPTTTVNLSGTSTKALEPTVAARTLDVTTTGEAGIDWANIGAPTTTVNLSGTSTKALEPTLSGRTLDVSSTGEAEADVMSVQHTSVTPDISGRMPSTLRAAESPSISTGTASAGGASTITIASGLVGVKGLLVYLISGTGAGQVRTATAYTSGTGLTTVDRAWDTNPDGATGYSLRVADSHALDANLAVTAGTVSDKTGYSLSGTQTFNLTGSITGNLSGSVGSVTGAVGSVTGAVGSVTGNVGGNVTGSVGSISGVSFPSGFSTLTVANIQSGLATAASQTTIAGYLDTEIASIKSVTDKLDTGLELDVSVYRWTANALEQAPAGGGGGGSLTGAQDTKLTEIWEIVQG